jgi:hypothetical protein
MFKLANVIGSRNAVGCLQGADYTLLQVWTWGWSQIRTVFLQKKAGESGLEKDTAKNQKPWPYMVADDSQGKCAVGVVRVGFSVKFNTAMGS